MQRWLAATLVIIPVGLVMGLLGARMVDSGTPRDEPRSQAGRIEAAGSTFRAHDALEPPDAARDRTENRARGRPDLDWEEEHWPEDHRGVAAGPYAYDDADYFGRRERDADEASMRGEGAGVTGPSGEAEAAARAAERAARDAVRAGAARPARRTPPALLPAPSPPPPTGDAREPRTADGDLPAIW